jgi:hypothetical protein
LNRVTAFQSMGRLSELDPIIKHHTNPGDIVHGRTLRPAGSCLS